MAKHNELGRQGEELAVRYLVESGYTILERNWRFKHWEVDIICSINGLLVVVEVKTRLADDEIPSELLTWRKRRNLLRAADAYVKMKQSDMELRFDLIIISGENNTITHIPEAMNILD